MDAEDAVEKERSSSGHANSAGVGDMEGDGDESRMGTWAGGVDAFMFEIQTRNLRNEHYLGSRDSETIALMHDCCK